jgi:hypothetical protein
MAGAMWVRAPAASTSAPAVDFVPVPIGPVRANAAVEAVRLAPMNFDAQPEG